jgi:hypothetical protein
MIDITGAFLVVLALCALLFVSSVNEGFTASIGQSSNNVYVSWPGGVMSPPPYSVTAGSDTGYHW